MIDNSEGSAVLGTASISAISNSNTEIQINPDGITMRDDDNVIHLGPNGITLPNGDYDHVLTSYGSTINIGKYATQSDLSAQLGPKANRSDLLTLEQMITANTIAIEDKAEDISSLRVGLSKKHDKITVNEVDITDIETADITKLRTIVTNLINALSASGLIRETETIE